MRLVVPFVPDLLEAEPLTLLSLGGAFMVVIGSALCAFGEE
jgi:hypothetical protein